VGASPKPIPPILNKLITTKGSVRITYLMPEIWKKINDLPDNFKSEGQHLLKTEEGLFLTIPGTGRLYKAKIIAGNIEFERIDSTYFSGYNFNSLSFNIGNSIYNFGGEGFWHVNGGLRIFDKDDNEWIGLKTNKSIHKSFNLRYPPTFFYYIDNENKNLYIEGSIADQNYVKDPFADSTFKNKLFKLDIIKGDWDEVGKNNYSNFYSLSLTPFGILSFEKLIDIKNNKVFTHNLPLKINSIFGKPTNDNNLTISFCIDSTIYFGNANNRFDSIRISRSNLTDTHQQAYIPLESPTSVSKFNIWIILLICSTLGFFILLYDKYFRKSTYSKNARHEDLSTNSSQQINKDLLDNPIVYKSGKLVELLSDQEKAFMSYIFQNSKDDRLTTIEELNKILGTFHKSIEIQKRVRSEMINNLNQKVSIITKLKRPIIDKQRSEFDKRSFEYYIQSENFTLINDILSLSK
jgi:hypothetical protein